MASAVGTVGRYCGHVALFTFTISACALLLIIVSYTNTIHCLPCLVPRLSSLRRGEPGNETSVCCVLYSVWGTRLTHQQQ